MTERRIKYLEKKYSETNISKGEVLSNESKKRINKNYNKNDLTPFMIYIFVSEQHCNYEQMVHMMFK